MGRHDLGFINQTWDVFLHAMQSARQLSNYAPYCGNPSPRRKEPRWWCVRGRRKGEHDAGYLAAHTPGAGAAGTESRAPWAMGHGHWTMSNGRVAS